MVAEGLSYYGCLCRTKPSPELSAELSLLCCFICMNHRSMNAGSIKEKKAGYIWIMMVMLPLNDGVLRLGGRTVYPYICSPRQLITVLLVTSVEVALARWDLSVQVSHRRIGCIICSGLQPLIVEVASAPAGRSVLTAELKTSSSFPSAAEGHPDLVKT